MLYSGLEDLKSVMRLMNEESRMSPKEYGQLYLNKRRATSKKKGKNKKRR